MGKFVPSRVRGVFLAACLTAAAAWVPAGTAGLLTDASFENGIDPLPDLSTGYWSYGVWGADNGAEVLAENGITPMDGDYMLRSLRDADSWSTTWQSIDLTPWAAAVDAGQVVLDYSAWVNTPDAGSPMRTGIGLRFYSSRSGADLLAFPQVGLWVDRDPSTWEPLSLVTVVPPGARHLVVELMYTSASLGNLPGYADGLSLSLTVIPTPSSASLGLVAAAVVAAGRLRRTF